MATLHLYLFGVFRLERTNQELTLPTRKIESLFAYLALHPTSHLREKLATLFWGDSVDEDARRSLRVALSMLRKALGEEIVLADRATVQLNPALALWTDVEEFCQCCRQGDVSSLQRAVALYAGEAWMTEERLAPELADDWLRPLRAHYHEQFCMALHQLGADAEENQQLNQALYIYQRLLTSDPVHEAACQGLLRVYRALGRNADGLAVYERFKQTLQQELGITPNATLTALAAALRTQAVAPAHPVARLVPFVGRMAEKAQLLNLLTRAQNRQGGIVVLLGEAGSGKTRLLSELSKAAGRRGWLLAEAKADELIQAAPYAPFSTALAPILSGPRLEQLRALVQPIWLNMVTRLTAPAVANANEQTGGADLATLALAIQRVLGGLQQIAPHLIVLDDIHWADPTLWSLLEAVRPALHELAVLMVISARVEELRSQSSAWSMVSQWETTGATVLALEPLSAQDLRQLAVALGQPEPSQTQLAHLLIESGGNPLLALALLNEEPRHPHLPLGKSHATQAVLHTLFQRRLDLLPNRARQVLQAAAVLGFQFQFAPLASLLLPEGMTPEVLSLVLGEVEQAELIVVGATELHFSHDTLRAYVYSTLPDAMRRTFHRRALTALKASTADDAQTPNYTLLLYHAEMAEAVDAIGEYAYKAAEQAERSYALPAAVAHLQRALATLPLQAVHLRFMATQKLADLFDVLGERAAQRNVLPLLQQLATALAEPVALIEAAHLHALYFMHTSEWGAALHWTQQMERLALAAGERYWQACALQMQGSLTALQQHFPEALVYFERACALYQQVGDHQGEANALVLLAQAQIPSLAYATAEQNLHRTIDLFQQVGDVLGECTAYITLSALWVRCARWSAAHTLAQQELARARTLNFRWGEAAAAQQLGLSEFYQGNFLRAIDLYDQARTAARVCGDTVLALELTLQLAVAYWYGDDAQTCEMLATQIEATLRTLPEQRSIESALLIIQGLLAGRRQDFVQAAQLFAVACTKLAKSGDWDEWLHSATHLAAAYLAQGDHMAAESWVTQMEQVIEASNTGPRHRPSAYCAMYRVRQAQNLRQQALICLGQAEVALQAVQSELSAPTEAAGFAHSPLYRDLIAALQAERKVLEQLILRSGVPHHPQPERVDYILVRWTLFTPADLLVPEPTERRRSILQRLLCEAEAQGAAPTSQDLADALETTRQEIARDLQALRAATDGKLAQLLRL